MRFDQAEKVVDTVMSAWDWQMEPGTLESWQNAIASLEDHEAAELAVVELYMGWTRQQGKHPMIGDVTTHYAAVKRRLDAERPSEAIAELPEPIAPPDTPQEVLELVNRLRSEGKRGGDLVRAVLLEKGIDAPVDPQHVESFDPPLTRVERQHRIHVLQRITAPTCRFCSTEGGTDEATEERAAAQ